MASTNIAPNTFESVAQYDFVNGVIEERNPSHYVVTQAGPLDYRLIWLAGCTLAGAHSQHPEEADHGIKGVIPLREAASNLLPDAVLKRDALDVSPLEEGYTAEPSHVVLIALAALRLPGEPAVAFCRVGFGNNDVPRPQQ